MRDDGLIIRLADMADEEAIAKLQMMTSFKAYLEIIPDERKADFEKAMSNRDARMRYWHDRLDQMRRGRSEIVLVATLGDAVIGVIALRLSDRMFIQSLYINPKYRGNGYGGKLLEYAHTMYCGDAQLEVLSGNIGAISFYRRHGYVITGKSPHLYYGAAKEKMKRVTD